MVATASEEAREAITDDILQSNNPDHDAIDRIASCSSLCSSVIVSEERYPLFRIMLFENVD